MHWLRFVIIVLIAAILQGGLINAFAVTGSQIAPDMFLILLVFFAIYSEPYDAVIISFALGFAADIAGTSLGPHTIAFGLMGTLLSDLNRFMAVRKMPQQAATIFVMGLAAGMLVHLLSSMQGHGVAASIFNTALWTPVYSAVVGPFLFLPAAWVMRIKTHRFVRG